MRSPVQTDKERTLALIDLVNKIGRTMAEFQELKRRVLITLNLADAPMKTDLTVREMEILLHINSGMSNKEIAIATGISERTAKFHVSRIMLKMGVRSRHELRDRTVAVR